MNHFLIRLWGVMKSGFYTISSVVGPRKSSKALPKAKLAPRKGHGHCLVVCCQSDPLQLSKSQGNHYIWAVLANWWAEQKTAMPAASIGELEGPMFLCHNAQQHVTWPMLQKLNELGWMRFCLINHIHLTYRQPPLLQASQQLFAGKMLPQPAGGRKCFLRVHWISKQRFLYYRNKTYFSLAKICWLKWFLFWLIKMCLCLVIMI